MNCSKCISKPDDISCSDDCTQMLINKAIAARDKWLIEQIEQLFGDGHARPLIQASPSQWEDLTESLEGE